jgi:UDP-N-acetylmuramyl pentapeptide synthase
LRKQKRAFFVVGDMRELGQQSKDLHIQLGNRAARSGVSALFVTGDFTEYVVQGAREAGLGSENIFSGSKEDLMDRLVQMLKPGDWVLVKGSRAMAMEDIVTGLRNWAEQ